MEGLRLFNTFKVTVKNKKKYKEVIKVFEAYCTPQKLTVFNCYKCFNRSQMEGESFNQFLTEIKMPSSVCEFGDRLDSLVRDNIVIQSILFVITTRSSYKLRQFVEQYNFEIIHSSPYHHQSNELCEKALGISKRLIKRQKSPDDLYNALLEYRVTPVADT